VITALIDIPETLHKQRAEVAKKGRRKLATLVHNELLLRFLLVMVWRQRNIRECRLGSNLFKDTISPFAGMIVPRSATRYRCRRPHKVKIFLGRKKQKPKRRVPVTALIAWPDSHHEDGNQGRKSGGSTG
jgi:hypothetical protein